MACGTSPLGCRFVYFKGWTLPFHHSYLVFGQNSFVYIPHLFDVYVSSYWAMSYLQFGCKQLAHCRQLQQEVSMAPCPLMHMCTLRISDLHRFHVVNTYYHIPVCHIPGFSFFWKKWGARPAGPRRRRSSFRIC